MPLQMLRKLGEPEFSLTYRSHAAAPISKDDLESLGVAASARNHAEGVTGLMIYEDGRFFQWLEGPAAGLSHIWDSVSRDPRHTRIEGVSIRPTSSRMFGGWGMRVLQRDRPKPLIVAAVAPQRADVATQELTQLLLAPDSTAAAQLAQEAQIRIGLLTDSSRVLFEPVARRLGNMWSEDECTGMELTLAMMRLQTILRGLEYRVHSKTVLHAAVLVAPQPGEAHMLGSTLDTELLWQAGCDAKLAFPETNDALASLVASTWFDALDLSLSAAMTREDKLPSMAVTIARARHASLNPALFVIVGGRWFSEQLDESRRVGANMTCASAAAIVTSVQLGLRRPRRVRAL